MSQPYVGEIRMFAGNFAPSGWMLCQGQLLSISDENNGLFVVLGTTYGGDGSSTFALPDLRGRVPIHMGNGAGTNSIIGQSGGVETVTLTIGQIPNHNHMPAAANFAGSDNPSGNVWGPSMAVSYTDSPSVNMNPAAIASAGNSLPHDNMIPYLGINFIISLFGIFPSQA